MDFQETLLVLILVFIIILIIYQYFSNIHYSNLHKIHNVVDPSNNIVKTNEQSQINNTTSPVIQQTVAQQTVAQQLVPPPIDIVREYDYATLNDPLIPPWKRDDYSYSLPTPGLFTRGYPMSFKKMGLLIDEHADNSDKFKFLTLIGRQKYENSNIFEYYASDNSGTGLKFEIPKIKRELGGDEEIEIKELKKKYKVRIDKTLGFDYVPF